jgi:hypothetical protein
MPSRATVQLAATPVVELRLAPIPPLHDDNRRYEVAFHEAGHFVMGRALGIWDIDSVTIQPGVDFAGRCGIRDLPAELLPHRLRAVQIMMLMGGYASMMLWCGDGLGSLFDDDDLNSANNVGADGDLKEAMNVAEMNHGSRARRYIEHLTWLTAAMLHYLWPCVERVAEALMRETTIDDRHRLARIAEGRAGRGSRLSRTHDRFSLLRGRPARREHELLRYERHYAAVNAGARGGRY